MLAHRTVSDWSGVKSERDSIDDAEKWRAVLARDASMDGIFVVGVRTTGIYCRPSCPSKHPLRENVQFFSETDEAEKAGFRACKRCRPREQNSHSELITRIAGFVNQNLDEKLTLESLSHEAGLSRFHSGLSSRRLSESRHDSMLRLSV